MPAFSLTQEQIQAVFDSGDEELIADLEAIVNSKYYTWHPRRDNVAEYDEQSGFVYARDLISFLLGGNGSGKTEAAGYKCAHFLLEDQEAPRPDTPFWVIGNDYKQSCGSCWFQKLQHFLPHECVDWGRISWLERNRLWPFSVPLKPWPGGDQKNNWILEFKSCAQGREAMQASEIGGFWFSEQFPWEMFLEVLRGCRTYMFPGGQFCEFTPIDPALSVETEKAYLDPPKGWGFYRLNESKNTVIKEEWRDTFFGQVSDEMQATRRIGAFASYEGTIYPSFNHKIHVLDYIPEAPAGCYHRRAIDWGASTDHPFVCLWAYKNGLGQYHIYDEYWNNSQNMTALDHIEEIKNRHPWPESDQRYGVTFADPSRPDLLNLFGQMGIPIQPAANDVDKGIETVRRRLKILPSINEPMLFISRERCPHLLKEFPVYRWLKSSNIGLNPQAARPVPLKKDDDCMDTLRYLLHTDYQQSGVRPPQLVKAGWQPKHGQQFSRMR